MKTEKIKDLVEIVNTGLENHGLMWLVDVHVAKMMNDREKEVDHIVANYEETGLEVNATIDNETNHIVQFIVSEFTFNLVDVGDVYAGGTCKMADIHDMIKNGTITFLE